MNMIAHRPRHADATSWAFRLEPGGDDHAIAVQIGSVGNRVADIDPNAEADGTIRRMALVMIRNLLLDLHCTLHRAFYAVEDDEQRIAAGPDDPATMLRDRRVKYAASQCLQPSERSNVVQRDKPAVANHVGID